MTIMTISLDEKQTSLYLENTYQGDEYRMTIRQAARSIHHEYNATVEIWLTDEQGEYLYRAFSDCDPLHCDLCFDEYQRRIA